MQKASPLGGRSTPRMQTPPEQLKARNGNIQWSKSRRNSCGSFLRGKSWKGNPRGIRESVSQVFDTYWLVQFHDNLYIIDQHAAHERVLYERTLKEMKTREFTSQYLSPPIILNLSMQEAEVLNTHKDRFAQVRI